MKFPKILAFSSLLSLAATNVLSYDVVDRFKLIDDKLKTEQMLRPIGHDFFLDFGAALNKNATDVVTDISDAGKVAGDKVAAAQAVLLKYDKTEQTIKLNIALGFPIFRFSAWDLKVQPNIRAFADAGANLGIRTDVLTTQDLINLFPSEVPADLKTFIGTLNAGDDVIDLCNSEPSLSVSTKAFCATQPTGKYIIPDLSSAVPNLALFAKLDAKVGLFNDYSYGEHFFGNLNL